ncbi:MAG: carboxypeptidase-like regulatory domain-containing protein [Candidatus Korobacteraceae bacterium]
MSYLCGSVVSALMVLSAVISVSHCAVGQVTAIRGQVLDSEGAAIPNARVLVHWDSSGSKVGLKDNIGLTQDLTVTTDIKGHFLVTVPPGFYDVFVTAQAFTPVAAKVRVKENEPASFNPTLRADPQVARELVDTFY